MEVQGESVHRHPAGNPDADGCDLAPRRPHPRVTGLGPRLDPEVRQGLDQCLLEPTDVGNDLLGIVETQDGIADQLTRAVECDVSAAIDVVHLDPQPHAVDEQVRAVPVAADGEDRRVFEQQEVVVPSPADDLALVDGTLQIPRFGIGQPTEPAGAEGHASSCSQSQVSRFCLMRWRKSTAVEPSNAR